MKRKLTVAEKAEKRRRKALYQTVFINGRQKRVLRVTPAMERMQMEEFVIANGNEIDLLQLGLYEHLYALEMERDNAEQKAADLESDSDSIPF